MWASGITALGRATRTILHRAHRTTRSHSTHGNFQWRSPAQEVHKIPIHSEVYQLSFKNTWHSDECVWGYAGCTCHSRSRSAQAERQMGMDTSSSFPGQNSRETPLGCPVLHNRKSRWKVTMELRDHGEKTQNVPLDKTWDRIEKQ